MTLPSVLRTEFTAGLKVEQVRAHSPAWLKERAPLGNVTLLLKAVDFEVLKKIQYLFGVFFSSSSSSQS